MARTTREKAVLYAAYKALERELEMDGELPPGTNEDVTGVTLSITLPPGSVVEREVGPHGNGLMLKKSVQNLYGYPVWAAFAHRLLKFHQWAALRRIMLEAITEVLTAQKPNVREHIRDRYPAVITLMDELQQELPIPPRHEKTPRLFKETGLSPTLTMKKVS